MHQITCSGSESKASKDHLFATQLTIYSQLNSSRFNEAVKQHYVKKHLEGCNAIESFQVQSRGTWVLSYSVIETNSTSIGYENTATFFEQVHKAE